MPWDVWINIKQKKSLTTRFVFHVALDEQVQVCINLHILTSFTNDVSVTYGRRY